MKYKNTICSHCQPWDETNLLSMYSGKAIETVEFHKGLGILIDNCFCSPGPIFSILWGNRSRILGFILRISLATKKRNTAATFN